MLLQSVWFFLWGILWAFYFALDGYDFGAAILRPFVARSDSENRVVYNAMGPFWDANEVWLITAGGVTFAAFPAVYAAMFSTLYSPLLIILFGLILRAVTFEFRGKRESVVWRKFWDGCQFVGSFVPALLFGVAFSNIFQGIPFDAFGIYHGSLLGLLNPYGILGGVVFVAFFLLHGALWLAIRTTGPVYDRTVSIVPTLWIAVVVLAVIYLVYTAFATPLFNNYFRNPLLFIVPLAAVASLMMVGVFASRGSWWKAFFASAGAIIGVTMFGIIGLYPNLYPSSLSAVNSLTAFNSSSGNTTLTIMLITVLIFLPIVVAYQIWTHVVFGGKITDETLSDEESY